MGNPAVVRYERLAARAQDLPEIRCVLDGRVEIDVIANGKRQRKPHAVARDERTLRQAHIAQRRRTRGEELQQARARSASRSG